MWADLSGLAAQVADVSNGDIIFITDPKSYTKIAFNRGADFEFEVLPSSALAAGVVIALAAPAFVVAVDPNLRISSSKESTVQLDTAPVSNILSTGSPVRSLFQTDSIAVRIIFNVSWALRAPAASSVAWTQSITW
jgi:hypothetical protein